MGAHISMCLDLSKAVSKEVVPVTAGTAADITAGTNTGRRIQDSYPDLISSERILHPTEHWPAWATTHGPQTQHTCILPPPKASTYL